MVVNNYNNIYHQYLVSSNWLLCAAAVTCEWSHDPGHMTCHMICHMTNGMAGSISEPCDIMWEPGRTR